MLSKTNVNKETIFIFYSQSIPCLNTNKVECEKIINLTMIIQPEQPEYNKIKI